MLPEINLINLGEDNYSIEFTYLFNKPQKDVWSFLTDKSLMKKWWSDLSLIDEIEVGNHLHYTDQNKNEQHAEILAFDSPRLFSFTWSMGFIKIELSSTNHSETYLAFQYWVPLITDQSHHELSQWILNLELLETLLNNKEAIDKKSRYYQIDQYVEKLIKEYI
ncbi:SRPBCC domain-containing protein [Facklamia sp. 7083-14-GEN3]|uniref:SRPBCC family protein n=1 Tax=Facklamia sp. 7083-14-GEN3 TaxID=2973478 RepID=UPI00215D4EFE|nr:SRPBCC domain-containing protein [Facklamia sp. 7083-14-GEN3]MCR8970005.1 SRPBCC domain-containing protein [Facklamia sp. 7083-14-GEN3]